MHHIGSFQTIFTSVAIHSFSSWKYLLTGGSQEGKENTQLQPTGEKKKKKGTEKWSSYTRASKIRKNDHLHSFNCVLSKKKTKTHTTKHTHARTETQHAIRSCTKIKLRSFRHVLWLLYSKWKTESLKNICQLCELGVKYISWVGQTFSCVLASAVWGLHLAVGLEF